MRWMEFFNAASIFSVGESWTRFRSCDALSKLDRRCNQRPLLMSEGGTWTCPPYGFAQCEDQLWTWWFASLSARFLLGKDRNIAYQWVLDNSAEDRAFVWSPLPAKNPVALHFALLAIGMQTNSEWKEHLLACWGPVAHDEQDHRYHHCWNLNGPTACDLWISASPKILFVFLGAAEWRTE